MHVAEGNEFAIVFIKSMVLKKGLRLCKLDNIKGIPNKKNNLISFMMFGRLLNNSI